jgi:hypothetical protein
MSFSSYLAEHLTERLQDERILTVYDPSHRYRDICRSLLSEQCSFVDAQAMPLLEARQQVYHHWVDLRVRSSRQLLIYRGEVPPERDEDLRQDPLAAFTVIGGRFPRAGVAAETYRDLALGAYPDRRDEVEALFQNGEPTIAALDALSAGENWPTLGSITGESGPTEILLKLFDETKDKLSQVLSDASAKSELQRLLQSTLEMPAEEVADQAEALRTRLWKRLLISEFLLDLPEEAPSSLISVPHTSEKAKHAVFRLCNRLRQAMPSNYIERARTLVTELDLDDIAGSITEFGEIDTFAFENAANLRSAVEALRERRVPDAQGLVSHGRESIWYKEDGSLKTPWEIIATAIETVEAISKADLPPKQTSLVEWYRQSGSAVDRSYRSFVFLFSRLEEEEPWGVPMGELANWLAAEYREWLDGLQITLVQRVQQEGWPLSGLLRQDRVFANAVEPHLSAGKRVAYFLVDALRFELGEALAGKLSSNFTTSVEGAGALLPTKTPLGMAALGPESGARLSVALSGSDWVVKRGHRELKVAEDRDSWFREYKGDQCVVDRFEEWLKRSKKKDKLPEKIRLAVIRTNDIDSVGEQSESVFRSALELLMTELARGVRKAFDLGFDVAVIASDHGFIYLPARAKGDKVSAPTGQLTVKSDRYAFGKVESADHLICMEEPELGYGLPGGSLALPTSLGTFAKPKAYVHGGLSLQEALIPVVTIESAKTTEKEKKLSVSIRYRDKERAVVRSLRPAITVQVGGASGALDFEEEWATRYADILIDIRTESDRRSAGQVDPNDFLDPDTGALHIAEGTTTQIPVRINEDIRETVVVRAIDRDSEKSYGDITLDIDILE